MNRLSRRRTRLPILLATALAAAAASLAVADPAAAAPAPVASAPVEADRLAIAQEVVALAFPVERRRALFARVTDALLAQVRTAALGSTPEPVDPGVQAILDRYFVRLRAEADRLNALAAPELFEAFARAYARMFTRDELVQIRAFVATPAGAKYVQRSADLLSDPDVARANTAHIERTMRAMEPAKDAFLRELKDYLEKRPAPKRT
jgi:hypothetical protein